MKVKALRLNKGFYPHKMKDYFAAGEKTKIERFTNGDYLVEFEGKPAIVPAHMVEHAEVEHEMVPAVSVMSNSPYSSTANKVPVSELKK